MERCGQRPGGTPSPAGRSTKSRCDCLLRTIGTLGLDDRLGIPTALAISRAREAIHLPIIGSGGVATGVDAAKAIRLGADLDGLAATLLPCALTSPAARDALTVKLDSGVTLSITPETDAAVSHGYAATIHKSQGATVDTAHVLVTGGIDRHKAYVAFSRHRRSLSIYAPQDQLRGQELLTVLSRSDSHANAIATGVFRVRRGIDATVPEREPALSERSQ